MTTNQKDDLIKAIFTYAQYKVLYAYYPNGEDWAASSFLTIDILEWATENLNTSTHRLILRPLSDLHIIREYNGKHYRLMDEIDNLFLGSERYSEDWRGLLTNWIGYDVLPVCLFEMLIAHQIDVYELIPQGLAVNMNTYQTNENTTK